MRKPHPTFHDWLRAYGVPKLAKEVGVCRTTPYKWLLPKSHPRYKRIGYYTAMLIQAIACKDFKEFTVEEIMGGKK